jgi:hypothetical protein
VSILAESHSMLQRLEQGLGGGDLESLPALLAQVNSAKSRSGALARVRASSGTVVASQLLVFRPPP